MTTKPRTSSLADALGRHALVADGAWGTQLHSAGLPPGHLPDEWNLSHPDEVRAVAASYVAAGSDIILTNTFRSHPMALAADGLAERGPEIARAGVEISRAAAADRAWVMASIGPCGVFMPPIGEHSEEEISAGFLAQAKGLAAGRPDGFVVETMSDAAEAVCAVRAIREVSDLPVVVSMTFDTGKDSDRTMMGLAPEQIVEAVADLQINAIGANCGTGPEPYVELCRRYRAVTDLPIWIKANAGMPRLEGGREVFDLDPESYARFVPALIEAGASIIGGCCGTTPSHISRIRGVVGDGARA